MERYKGVSGEEYQNSVHASSKFVFDLIANNRAAKLSPFIKKSDTVLEYGIGTGWNLTKLQAHEKHGFDVFLQDHALFKAAGIVVHDNDKDIPKNYFNKVICHHVLEHVSEPIEILRSFKRFLVNGGEVILFVPFEVGRKYKKYNAADKNRHLYSWTVQTFCALVEEAGFKVEQYKILKKGYDRFAGNLIEKYHLPVSFYKLLRGFLTFIKPEYEIFVKCKT